MPRGIGTAFAVALAAAALVAAVAAGVTLAAPATAEGPADAARPAASGGPAESLDGVVLVRLAAAYGGLADVRRAAGPSLAAMGMRLEAAAVGLPWARIRLPAGTSVADALASLGADPRYAVVQPVRVYRALRTPDDPGFGAQWHLQNVGQDGGVADADVDAPEAWDLLLGETTVEIAVLDTGADTDHPDLAARLRIVAGCDLVDGDGDPNDDSTVFASGHGTAVSGVAAAVSNNAAQIAGGTWYGRIVPIRVLNVDGSGTTDSVAAGVDLARGAGVDVINLSIGAYGRPGDDPLLDAALSAAAAAGIVVVAASGNDGGDVLYPANHSAALAVGATRRTGSIAGYSNGGEDLDLVAPGSDIRTLAARSETQTVSGTSLSSPLVAAGAALAAAARPGADTASLFRWLRATAAGARSDPWDAYAGAGVMNLRRLVEVAASDPAYDTGAGVILLDTYAGATSADSASGASYVAGRNGGTGLRLETAGRAGFGPARAVETGTIEIYWRPASLPPSGETRALLSAETVSLRVDASGGLSLRVGATTVSAPTPVHADQWYHLAVVHDETHVALWRNGVEECTAAADGRFAADTLWVGGRPGETTAAGVFDQLRISRASRCVFPCALDAAVPSGSWATTVVSTFVAPWWSMSSETRPVRVTLGADTDAVGLDGVVLVSGTPDDMRQSVSVSGLVIGTPYYLHVVADDGVDTAWAYATSAFVPSRTEVSLVAPVADGGGGTCVLGGLPGAAALRRLRDGLLGGALGRLVALLYYSS